MRIAELAVSRVRRRRLAAAAALDTIPEHEAKTKIASKQLQQQRKEDYENGSPTTTTTIIGLRQMRHGGGKLIKKLCIYIMYPHLLHLDLSSLSHPIIISIPCPRLSFPATSPYHTPFFPCGLKPFALWTTLCFLAEWIQNHRLPHLEIVPQP